MFAGQAAAPDGPVDMFMMYVMHHAFRRDLDGFVAAVAATPVEDRTTWSLLRDRWDAFGRYLHHHHSGEDAGLWPTLLERADADEREHLTAMEAEHAEIDPLLEACGAGFAALAHRPDADERAALLVRVTASRDRLGRHLAHEETKAMAILQRHLTQEDWHEIERRHFGRGDLRELGFVVPWAVKDLTAGQRNDVFARIGGPFKLIWRLTSRRFDRREARVFRYA
jgi:hypothetical protein